MDQRMRYDRDWDERFDALEPLPPLDDHDDGRVSEPPVPLRRRWIKKRHLAAGLLLLFMLAVGWLAITAPLDRSLQPIAPPVSGGCSACAAAAIQIRRIPGR